MRARAPALGLSYCQPVSATPIFELRGVSKRFAGQTALAGLDLQFTAGQTTVLIGPSGCGKTTVLRLLLGLVAPDPGPAGGEVRFRGELLHAGNLRQQRRQMGYVVQEGGLFPHLDAAANVTLMAQHVGMSRAQMDARVTELAELVRLPSELLKRHPRQLSGGERQRVSLMRALMLDPEVLLLDEPLGAIDPLMRAELQSDLSAVFQRLRKSVILVTHDLPEAVFFADTLVLMQEGRVVQRGVPADLLERPADAFVSRFVAAQRRLQLPGQQGLDQSL